MTVAAVPQPAPPAGRIAVRVAAGGLQRCGGRTCPPGTCDHDGTSPARLARQVAIPGHRLGGAMAPLSSVRHVLATPGEPLPSGTRVAFEQRLGHDFRGVRVHTDRPAAESARSVGAVAYTVGRHVVFGEGAFQPGSPTGRATLAHELVHTVQQGSGTSAPRAASGSAAPFIVPVDDPSEREAEQIARSTSINESARSPPSAAPLRTARHGCPAIQRQTGGQAAPQIGGPSTTTQSAPVSAAQRCADLLAATSAEAVRLIGRAEDSLTAFAAEQVYPLAPGEPGMAEHRRVAAHLTATFNTTDALDVQAIAARLARIRRALANNEIRMTCGTGCGASVGGSILGGRSPGPFQFTLCGTNATPVALAPTLIHESAHAVLPDIGTGSRPTTQSTAGVLDRAYDQERLFTHLSPTEALTNAESYSGLVVGLTSGTAPPASAAARDTVTGCPDRATIETAMGRAQVAARLVAAWLDGAIEMLRSSGETDVSRISDPFATNLQAAFPNVRTLADLRKVGNDASIIFNNFSNPESVRCAAAGSRCPPGRLGFVSDLAVTATGLSPMRGILDRSGFINVCPAWLGASDGQRTTTMYGLVASGYLGGAMIQLLTPADAMKLAEFAVVVVGRYLPSPRARSATEHLLH